MLLKSSNVISWRNKINFSIWNLNHLLELIKIVMKNQTKCDTVRLLKRCLIKQNYHSIRSVTCYIKIWAYRIQPLSNSYDFTAQTDTKLICLKWWNSMRFHFTCSIGFNSLLLSSLFSCFPYVQHSLLRVQFLPYGDSIALICAINWNVDASSKA